jgi:hypothetical protein
MGFLLSHSLIISDVAVETVEPFRWNTRCAIPKYKSNSEDYAKQEP